MLNVSMFETHWCEGSGRSYCIPYAWAETEEQQLNGLVLRADCDKRGSKHGKVNEAWRLVLVFLNLL